MSKYTYTSCQALFENMCILPERKNEEHGNCLDRGFYIEMGMLAAVLAVNNYLHLAIENCLKSISHNCPFRLQAILST